MRASPSSLLILAEMPTKVAFQLANFVVAAAYLPPADFGVAAVAFTLANFGVVVSVAGAESAVLRRQSIDDAWLRGVHTTSVCVGSVFAALLVLASYPLQIATQLPGLAALLLLASPIPLLSAATAAPRAVAVKERLGGLLLVSTLLASLASLVVVWAVVDKSGWLGALVLGPLTAAAIQCVITRLGLGQAPKVRLRALSQAHLKFAAGIMGADSLSYWGRNGDNLIVAALGGAAAVGIYERAYLVVITPVAFVVIGFQRLLLPRAAFGSPSSWGSTWLNATRAVSLGGCAVALVGAVVWWAVGPQLVSHQWAPIVPVSLAMCAVMAVHVVAGACGTAYILAGSTGRMFSINAGSMVLNLASVFVACFAGGGDALWAACGLALAGLAQLPWLLGLACTQVGLSWRRAVPQLMVAPAVASLGIAYLLLVGSPV